MNIILHEPEIPLNTGNIGRTCVSTNSTLHLIRPYGFFIDDKTIKRSGMDYWHKIKLFEYDNYAHFLEENPTATVFMATTKATKNYTQVSYRQNDFIMFGKESGGIPLSILETNQENMVRIPMFEDERSLNLSNSVSIVLYEALRQNNFAYLN